jgi:hypothetical protein
MVLPYRNLQCAYSSVNIHLICNITTKHCDITGEIYFGTAKVMESLCDLKAVNNAALVYGKMHP